MGNLEHNIDHILLSEDDIKGIVDRLAAHGRHSQRLDGLYGRPHEKSQDKHQN